MLIHPVKESVITEARQNKLDKGYWDLVDGRIISSPYGPRNGKFHNGQDYLAIKPYGVDTKVMAAHDGAVVHIGWSKGYGDYIIIDGDGFSTLYAHLNDVYVKDGQIVNQGQEIALMGNTGTSGIHLHFEYRDRTYTGNESSYWSKHNKRAIGEFYSSQDPLKFMQKEEVKEIDTKSIETNLLFIEAYIEEMEKALPKMKDMIKNIRNEISPN